MARPTNPSGTPYTIPVVVMLNPAGLTALDELRGHVPRSQFLRDLLRAELHRRRT